MSGQLKAITDASQKLYQTFKLNRAVSRTKTAEQALEAAKKGGFSNVKFKAGKVMKGLNVAAIGLAAFEIGKKTVTHGPAEGARAAVRVGFDYGPFLGVAKIPYVGPVAAGGLLAYDLYKGYKGEKTSGDIIAERVYDYIPSLKPTEEPEEPDAETSTSQFETQQHQSQIDFSFPDIDLKEQKRRQRMMEARTNAYQEGLRVLEEGL